LTTAVGAIENKTFARCITIGHLLTMSSGIKYEEGGDLPWSEEADDTKTYYATNLRDLRLRTAGSRESRQSTSSTTTTTRSW
jgi:CubicO group peptidase (beta-lactamase class C family)